MPSNKQVIELKNVSVTLGSKAILKDISLQLKAGEIYTLVGPSGTGKTTLLRLLAGLANMSQGEILLNNQPFKASEHVIGLVPQDYGLLPWQTVKQAIEISLKITQKKQLHVPETNLDELYQRLELLELLDQYPSQLSGGQKQRVAIARALAVPSELLLMDEPFSALDAFTREKSQQLFLDSWLLQPKTTLFITHDIEEAVLLGSEIIVLGKQPGTIIKKIENHWHENIKTIDQRRKQASFNEIVEEIRKEIYTFEK